MLNYLFVEMNEVSKWDELENWLRTSGYSYEHKKNTNYADVLRQEQIPAMFLLYQNENKCIVRIDLGQQTRCCYADVQDLINQIEQECICYAGIH